MSAIKHGLLAGAAMLMLAVAMPARADVPDGSYRETCRDIRVHGDTLVAACERRDGSWSRTAMNLYGCRGFIENWNGRLACSRRDHTRDEYARGYDEDRRWYGR
jgi:hypothetical protein